MEIKAVILAAGKGTRMNSEEPKCAHYIIDKSMVEYVVDSLNGAKVKDIITVVGYKKEVLEEILKNKTQFAYQEEQLGTAHAVWMAEEHLQNFNGLTLITTGDMPFISKNTYSNMIAKHIMENADLTLLSTDHPNPYGYGRIVRDANDEVVEIVEEKDCTKSQRSIKEINASIYLIDNQKLLASIHEIRSDNSQNEYYLTDIVKIFKKKNYKVYGYKTNDFNEVSGVNDKNQLSEMEEMLRKKIIKQHLANGVTIHNQQTVTIGVDVKIASGATINENSIIVNNSVIGKNSIIGPFTKIDNSKVGEGAIIKGSFIENSSIQSNAIIGPFAYISDDKSVGNKQ